MPLKMGWSINPVKIYVGAKGSALILSFGFSIIYSRLLGLENKSVLTFIFTVSSLLILGFISSLGLTLRKRISNASNERVEIVYYLKKLLSLTFILSVLFISLLITYSVFVTHLNYKIFALSLFLFITSSIVQGFNELMIGIDRLRTISLIENIEILVQLILFFTISKLVGFSIIISVMLAISITYTFSAIVILRLVFIHTKEYARDSIRFDSSSANDFKFFDSSSLYTILPFVVLDRIDKILIGFLLPLVSLSKYAVLLVFFSLVRFIPESISKTFFSRHQIRDANREPNLKFILITSIAASLVAYPLYVICMGFLLGKNWILPLGIFLAVAVFELARAIYLLQINRQFAENLETGFKITHIPWFIGMAVVLACISVHFVGLIGVPLSFALTYVTLIIKGKNWANRLARTI